MTITFTSEDWTTTVETPTGEQQGFVIPFTQHNVQEPIIQIYIDHGNNEFQLDSFSLHTLVTLINNDLIISSTTPFNGKIVIK